MKVIKKYLTSLYANARKLNDTYLLESIKLTGPHNTILDIGCWDGVNTMKYAAAAKADKILGIEVVKKMSEESNEKGIETFALYADRDIWPFPDNSIDCIVSNQVVEHLSNLDHYFSESARVLKKGGVLITSTNNLSSLHNIFALILGWTPFDLTNSSEKKLGIGNPMSIHRGESDHHASWTHKCIYQPRWLREWQEIYGFSMALEYGSGLYPLPASFGNLFKRYAAFMIQTMKKNSE